jgi:aerobic carbon-monoxide dehydrogenase medium subunit
MPEIAFHRPDTVEAAVSLLAGHAGSRCIAGGQTLVAMLNAGLLEAPVLIAVAGIAELNSISFRPNGTVRIGAAVSHRRVAVAWELGGSSAVIREAARVIAHPAIRNFGTIGGALAHADPAADYPAAVVAAGASIEIAGRNGRRTLPAQEFFLDYLTTVLEPGEMVTAVLVPDAKAGAAGHYLKFSRVDGDYAIVSIAVTLESEAGICSKASIALGGCGPKPVFDARANSILLGTKCETGIIGKAADILIEMSDPIDDVRASANYRRALIPRLLPRAIRQAWCQIGPSP